MLIGGIVPILPPLLQLAMLTNLEWVEAVARGSQLCP